MAVNRVGWTLLYSDEIAIAVPRQFCLGNGSLRFIRTRMRTASQSHLHPATENVGELKT